ncbi:hypothetical protein MMC28_010426 [Mycoblastus sanguinarius]|nr:hypothetical protein [Mycoblastus sanguinarius]
MDNFLLPATRYEAPPRLARTHILNTIIEDENSGNEEEHCSSDEEGEAHDRGRYQYPELPGSTESTSPVPSLTSSISSYYKTRRRSEDFDDMYDVSDDDSDISPSVMTSISACSTSPEPLPRSDGKQNRYPSLVIPSPSYWPTIQKAPTLSPPVPPKIPISPAALSMLCHDLPSSSNPPSLDGSLNSDPLAGSSAPTTPDVQLHSASGYIWGQIEDRQSMHAGHGKDLIKKVGRPEIKIIIDDEFTWPHESGFSPEDRISVRDFGVDEERDFSDSPVLGSEDGYSDVGVQLPPNALDTLQHLSIDIPDRPDSDTISEPCNEMEEAQVVPSRPSSADVTPMSQTSDYSISLLSIPSPGGFFSSLGSNARHTWCISGSGHLSMPPPSSTTAEQFYNCPWNLDLSAPVEQIVEFDDNDTEGPPTARQIPFTAIDGGRSQTSVDDAVHYIAPASPLEDHDDDYEQAIEQVAKKSLDRTTVWLAAQTSYMSALRETNPVNDLGFVAEEELKRSSSHVRNDSVGSPIKRAVRFLETELAKREYSSPKKAVEGESIYYHAFQHILLDRKRSDAFRHRRTRSDSIQASRMSLPHEHLARLQGEFRITNVDRPAPQRPISMMPGKEKAEETAEQKVIARVERERQALEQVNTRMWVIEAAKYLSSGRLLNSPAVNSLVKAPAIGDIENGRVKTPPRVLDIGGQPDGDWAWHCSREFTHAKVYTASTEHHLMNSRIRGPHNHRSAAVTKLWELPYPDNHFNAISARSLFTFLKTEKPIGEAMDEYDLCLHECLRCLKPGGYLEFFLLDSEVVNAGSRGTAVSVEFGFNLKTRGYDPLPTKSWLGRVRRAGFDDIKRAWTFLPMGTQSKEPPMLPETPPPDVSTFGEEKLEAVQGPVGSTADAASMSGLVGSWAWEQWMLKLQLEMGQEHLLEGVGAVLEEGKFTGAGWRCLSGWARKPMEESSA